MKMFIRLMAVALLCGAVLSPTLVFAKPGKRTPGAAAREHRQRKRIREGVKSGELTKDEAKGLRQEQRDIRQEKRDMKSDGVVTKEERKELHQDLNDASKDIYNEKHDDEKR